LSPSILGRILSSDISTEKKEVSHSYEPRPPAMEQIDKLKIPFVGFGSLES
jgi:hypothetical protein